MLYITDTSMLIRRTEVYNWKASDVDEVRVEMLIAVTVLEVSWTDRFIGG